MTTFHENIRNAFAEVDKFIDSLKGEKLSKKVQAGKEKLIETIKKLREEWPALENPAHNNELKVPESNETDQVSNESIKTKSSHGSTNAEEEEPTYSENVPEKSVKDLTDPVKFGYLDKKRKKATLLQSAYQKRFCIIKDRIFYYFEKNTDKKQAGAFCLEGYEFKETPQYVPAKEAGKKFCFELTASGKRPFQEKGAEEDNSYVFLVESKEEFQSWQDAITGDEYDDIDNRPGYDYMKPTPGAENRYMVHGSSYDGYLKPVNSPSHYQNDPPGNQGNRDSVYVDVATPPLPSVPPPSKKTETPPKLPPPRREPVRLTRHPEEDYENMYYGKWNHTAEAEAELAFKYGEIIHVISRELDKGGWWIARKGDQYGLVAKQFLVPAYTPFKGK